VDAREKGIGEWRREHRRIERGRGGGGCSKVEEQRERERERGTVARVDGWFEGIWGFPESSRTRAHAGGLARRLACIDQRAWQPRSVTAGAFGILSLSLFLVGRCANILSHHRTVVAHNTHTHTHMYTASVCNRRHYAGDVPTFRRCAICRARPLRGRRGAYRPIVTLPRDSAATYHALSRKRCSLATRGQRAVTA